MTYHRRMIDNPTFKSSELIERFGSLVLATHGSNREFNHTASPENSNTNSLVFLQNADQAPESAAVIVTTKDAAETLKDRTDAVLVCVGDVRLAQAFIKQHYDDYRADDSEWNPVHDSAVIHETATLGNDCRVGPNAVIGADCVIGDHTIIRANSVVEHGVTIGEYCIVSAGANIGYNSVIGDRVTIQAGAVIGSEGYGFAADSDNRYHRIPHTGNVMLDDDVHVGANSCIDRATYGSTTISRGVKIDNLVHIAHNVQVGEDSLLTAQTVIAGSSVIGKRVIASGQTGVLDHKRIPNDTVLVQRAGVSEDLPHGGMWAGSPAKPFKEWVRAQSLTKKVTKLEQSIKELTQKLEQALNRIDRKPDSDPSNT